MWNYSDTEYIKLFRKMLSWEWYTDTNTKVLFIHCLLKANWKSGSWHGIPYERGQFITSLSTLAHETGLTIKEIRTGLEHLIRTNEVASKSFSKYRIITVLSYDEYQGMGKQNGKEKAGKGASKGQARGKQGATDIRIYKNIRNKEEKEEEPLFEIVQPTQEEIEEGGWGFW